MAEIFQYSCFYFGWCTWSAGWWVSGFCLSTSIMLPQKYYTMPYVPYHPPHQPHHHTIRTIRHYIVCTIYAKYTMIFLPQKYHTVIILHHPYTLYATIYVVPYPPYKPYKRLHPHTKIPYNAVPCQSLRCHFLDHRMLFNSILFHVNQPWLLTNAFVFIRSF